MPVVDANPSARFRNVNFVEPEPLFTVASVTFFISLFAISFPGISKHTAFLRIPRLAFFIGKHLGTGVILSTAFCHLLPDAFKYLQGHDVNEKYHNINRWAGLIVLSSLLLIFLVEYVSTSYVDYFHAEPSAPSSASSSQIPSRTETLPLDGPQISTPDDPEALLDHRDANHYIINPTSPLESTPPQGTIPVTERTPLVSTNSRRKSRSLHNLNHHHHDEALLPLIVLNCPHLSRRRLPLSGMVWERDIGCLCREAFAQASVRESTVVDHDLDETERKDLKPRIGRKREITGILTLQLGIMIHSLVIGLTLAVTSGPNFISLVTALVFHQFFEGLSLGIRIASLPPAQPRPPPFVPRPRSLSSSSATSRTSSSIFHHELWQQLSWLTPVLSILFAITTPFGMILGLLAFGESGPGFANSARMQLTQGVMSGVSAGMLIYATTVEMLAADFMFNDVGGDHGHHSHDISHIHSHNIIEYEHNADPLNPTRRGSSIWKRALAVVSLLTGVTAMSLVR